MKKASLSGILVALLFVLTACGSGSASTNGFGGGGNSANGFRSGNGGTRALTADAKLALGTMKLEGTKEAVEPKTAAKLIPLWQLLVQLHSSSSSAPQEVSAVVDQIKSTMTTDQLNTINGMSLTQADIFSAFQAQNQASGSGGTTDPGGQAGQGSGQGFSRGNRGNGGVFVFGGGPGGGGFGGGGFGGGGARTANGAGSQTSSALTAAQAAQARENAISALLENQLVRLLETKLSN